MAKAKAKVEVEKKQPVKLTKSILKRLLSNADFGVVSNTRASMFYKCSRTGQELHLNEFGDMDSMSFDAIASMNQKSKSLLNTASIIIEDVYIPDSDEIVEIKDVYEYLGLGSVYGEIEKHCIDTTFDEILLQEKVSSFAKRIKNMDKKILTTLLHRAVELFNKGQFTDHAKMTYLKETSGNIYLFESRNL